MKTHVHETFNNIRSALDIREQLLRRQIDAIHHQNRHKHRKTKLIEQMKFLPENQENVLSNIRTLGKFNLDNFQTSDAFTVEDYICPTDDHDFMYKGLNGNHETEHNELTVVDFSNNTALIKENTNIINDSIVNMTLNESRELIEESKEMIEKAKLFEFDEFLAGRESQLSYSDKEPMNTVNKNTSNIKIHNCSGTINLKNISKLTINTNCRSGDRTKNNRTFISPSSDTNSSIASGNDVNCAAYNCEFYNRLINEIKNSIKRSDHGDISCSTKNNGSFVNNGNGSFLPDSNSFDSHCNKILLQNIKNFKIQIPNGTSELNGYLDANTITHPIQIEEWLKQIISETEIEPMQNLEILEHSIINTPATP